jgi:RNA polymerase sigma-70 factor (TIGR02954 family)
MSVGGVDVNLEQLVLEAQKGDDNAFYQLMQLHKERLYRVAYAFLRNEPDALEVIQEATCRAYLKKAQLKQPAFFSTWLTRILIHCCIHEQKRKKRWVVDGMQRDYADSRVDYTDDRLLLQDAMARLAPEQRHIIILKYFEDLTIREIATLLGHPEGTIKTWLHKALSTLRRDLGKEGDIG